MSLYFLFRDAGKPQTRLSPKYLEKKQFEQVDFFVNNGRRFEIKSRQHSGEAENWIEFT